MARLAVVRIAAGNLLGTDPKADPLPSWFLPGGVWRFSRSLIWCAKCLCRVAIAVAESPRRGLQEDNDDITRINISRDKKNGISRGACLACRKLSGWPSGRSPVRCSLSVFFRLLGASFSVAENRGGALAARCLGFRFPSWVACRLWHD